MLFTQVLIDLMAKNPNKKSISLTLRNYFITGVVVLIPIGFTLYLSKILISLSSNIIPQNINPNSYLPYAIPGVEILISIIFITFVGGLSLSFLGKRVLKLIDNLFKKIPLLRTIYTAILQMTETFSNKDNDKKSVVLIEYPRKGVWAVGFATKENTGEMALKTNKKLMNVFVPTTPNPTSGFLLMFPKDEVIYLDISFEEGIYVDKEARTITIDEITNISINLPKVSFNIACSKGTYIRSIARDLGNQLECGGHLSRLIRTSQEKFTINSAISIDEAREEDIIPLENAFDNLNTITLNQLDADAFINGVPLKLKIDHSDLLRVYDPSKKFIAIGKNTLQGFKHEYLV